MAMSRPRKYKTVEEMQKAIDNYFMQCDAEEKPYTVVGLALALGFEDRRSLLDYMEYEDEDDIDFSAIHTEDSGDSIDDMSDDSSEPDLMDDMMDEAESVDDDSFLFDEDELYAEQAALEDELSDYEDEEDPLDDVSDAELLEDELVLDEEDLFADWEEGSISDDELLEDDIGLEEEDVGAEEEEEPDLYEDLELQYEEAEALEEEEEPDLYDDASDMYAGFSDSKDRTPGGKSSGAWDGLTGKSKSESAGTSSSTLPARKAGAVFRDTRADAAFNFAEKATSKIASLFKKGASKK